MLAKVRLEARLHVRMPLNETLMHLCKQFLLLLKPPRQQADVRIRGLPVEPRLGVHAHHVLEPTAVEAHEHEVLELRVHGYGLIVLRRTAHVDAVRRLAVRYDARAPPRDDPHGTVHRGDDLPADLPELRIRQASDPLHQRMQFLDGRSDRGHIRRHGLRPILAVLLALVQVLAVRAVAGDHIEGLAQDEVA